MSRIITEADFSPTSPATSGVDSPVGGALLLGKAMLPMRERMERSFAVTVLAEEPDADAYLDAHGESILAIGTDGHQGADARLINRLPNLRIISCYGVGYDAIDVEAAVEAGIIVTHTPDVLNDEVAHTAIMLMLATGRRLLAADAHARSGAWQRDGDFPLTRSLVGKRVGMVGFGRIGQTIARKLSVFGCSIAYHARHCRSDAPERWYEDVVALAGDSDYLVVIVPGGAATRHLVNGDVLDALGSEGTLINVARGSVVDETALAAALESGRLGAAGLDVFTEEPMIPEALKSSHRVVLTPHVGSATEETRAAMGALAVANLEDFFTRGAAITPVPECRVAGDKASDGG